MWSLQSGSRAVGSAVLTALFVQCAKKGSTAAMHCEKMVGISAKIVKAAKLLRFATGVGPLSVIGCGLGFGIDNCLTCLLLISNSQKV